MALGDLTVTSPASADNGLTIKEGSALPGSRESPTQRIEIGESGAVTSARDVAAHLTPTGFAAGGGDSGHENLPVGGQLISPLVATKSPH